MEENVQAGGPAFIRAKGALKSPFPEQSEERLRALEQALAERTVRCQEHLDALEILSCSLSLDLRDALRSVFGFTQLLLETYGEKAGPTVQDYLRRILAAAERMNHLTLDMLALDQIACASKLKLEPVAVQDLLQRILKSRPLSEQRPFQVQPKGRLPVVLANEKALTLCLTSLLSCLVQLVNSSAPPRVQVWAEAKGPHARLWFVSQGAAFSKDAQTRLKAIFQSGVKGFEVPNLGLAIARHAAERIGGRAGIEFDARRRARFWLEFQER